MGMDTNNEGLSHRAAIPSGTKERSPSGLSSRDRQGRVWFKGVGLWIVTTPLCYRKGVWPFYSILLLIGHLTVTGVTDEIGSPAKLILSH